MSDFESRLTDALSSGAEGAPDASGLADGARRRSRQRRRTTVAVAAAAVLAAVAVPVGVLAIGDGGSDTRDAAEDPPAADTRIETWHDLQVEVPASWGYGARSAWCIGGEVDTPVVERPGAVVTLQACETTYSFGVSWSDGTAMFDPVYPSGHVWQYEAGDVEEYVPGSWLGYWYEGDDYVQVNAADKETVQAIIDSVQRLESVDDNGCPVERQEGFSSDSEEMSVCRYDAGGQLEQSELLSAEDTAAATAALEAAPAGNPEMLASCAQDQLPRLVVQLISADVNSEVILQAPCPYKPGITSGGESFQELTEDVLYWALSPGWVGALQDVPMPEELRTLPAEHSYESGDGPCAQGVSAVETVPLSDDPGGPLTVCRMDVDWQAESGGSYVLAETRQLDEAQSAAVRSAVAAAPSERNQLSLDCLGGPAELFVVHAGADPVFALYNGECGRMSLVTAPGGEVETQAVTPELLDALGSPHGLLRSPNPGAPDNPVRSRAT